jgi:aspartate/methionine/tyrosine aminotransferase
MIFDPVLTPVLLKIQDAIPTHPAIASQLIALQAIQITSHGGACSGWIEENVYKLKKCRDVIFDAVEATGAIRSYGAIYYFVPLPVQWRNQTSEVEAMRILAEKFQVLLTPGRAFGAPGYFRVSYGSQPDDVCFEAAGRLKCGLSFLAEREPTVPATSKRSERSQE